MIMVIDGNEQDSHKSQARTLRKYIYGIVHRAPR